MEEWIQNEQKEAQELITEYAGIFAISDMDLCRTSLVKHSIRLTDNTPFMEHYLQISPLIYKEVREHWTEMLQIGAIWPSNSPWASLVVLVCKKDSNLQFGIGLRKLNAPTIKESYSLPG